MNGEVEVEGGRRSSKRAVGVKELIASNPPPPGSSGLPTTTQNITMARHRNRTRGTVALATTLLLISTSIQPCTILLLLLPNTSSTLEANFTPNPQDSIDNGGNGGPLPASTQQRRQLLELEVTILNSQDPLATLDHVAKTNGLSREELTGMLDRNRRDLEESGQLEDMLGEMHAAMQTQGGGGGGVGGAQRRSMADSSLPRRLIGFMFSVLLSWIKTACIHISRHPKRSTVLSTMLTCTFLAMHNAPRNGIVISSGTSFSPLFSNGHTTLLAPPVEYLERYFLRTWQKGGYCWASSLPEPMEVAVVVGRKSAKSKKKSEMVGGVGMTRLLNVDTPEAVEGKVTVETRREGSNNMIDGFALVSTAQTMIRHHGNDETQHYRNGNDDSAYARDGIECVIESAKFILGERKFTEFVPGNSGSMKFRSFLVSTSPEEENDEAVEGAVMAMKLLGDFRRFGVQPLCFSYETNAEDDDDDNNNADNEHAKKEGSELMTHCVAFHTLRGGHFDGELRFSVEEKENGGVVINVTLAIPHGGRSPTARLAEEMVSSIAHSIAQSTLIRTKQTLSRRMQSKAYRARASSRAALKRHSHYEHEKAQEEMAAERKRKWKRNNPDAGHYRPSGHRLKSPNNC